jgi:hypothetical protein
MDQGTENSLQKTEDRRQRTVETTCAHSARSGIDCPLSAVLSLLVAVLCPLVVGERSVSL